MKISGKQRNTVAERGQRTGGEGGKKACKIEKTRVKLENHLIMFDNMSGTKIGQELLLFLFWNMRGFCFFQMQYSYCILLCPVHRKIGVASLFQVLM